MLARRPADSRYGEVCDPALAKRPLFNYRRNTLSS